MGLWLHVLGYYILLDGCVGSLGGGGGWYGIVGWIGCDGQLFQQVENLFALLDEVFGGQLVVCFGCGGECLFQLFVVRLVIDCLDEVQFRFLVVGQVEIGFFVGDVGLDLYCGGEGIVYGWGGYLLVWLFVAVGFVNQRRDDGGEFGRIQVVLCIGAEVFGDDEV